MSDSQQISCPPTPPRLWASATAPRNHWFIQLASMPLSSRRHEARGTSMDSESYNFTTGRTLAPPRPSPSQRRKQTPGPGKGPMLLVASQAQAPGRQWQTSICQTPIPSGSFLPQRSPPAQLNPGHCSGGRAHCLSGTQGISPELPLPGLSARAGRLRSAAEWGGVGGGGARISREGETQGCHLCGLLSATLLSHGAPPKSQAVAETNTLDRAGGSRGDTAGADVGGSWGTGGVGRGAVHVPASQEQGHEGGRGKSHLQRLKALAWILPWARLAKVP